MRAPTKPRKVTFIGPEGAGRSRLMHQLKENKNVTDTDTVTDTLNFGFLTSKNNEKIKIQDLNGTDRFKGVRENVLRDEKQDLIVIVVNKDQPDEIKKFLDEIDGAYPDVETRPPIGLVITDPEKNFNKESFCRDNFARFCFVSEGKVDDIVPELKAQLLNTSKIPLAVKSETFQKKLPLVDLVDFIANKGGLNDTHIVGVIHYMSIDQGARSDFKYTSPSEPDIPFSMHDNINARVINIEKILNFNKETK